MIQNNKSPKLLGDPSIHTFCLYHTLTNKEYQNIHARYSENFDDHNTWPETTPKCNNTSPMIPVEQGLRIQPKKAGGGIPFVKIIVNPLLISKGKVCDYKRIAPSNPQFWLNLPTVLDEVLERQNFPFHADDCKLSRADLCMNLEMGPEFNIPKYLSYLKRTPCKEGYELQTFDDEEKDSYSYKVQNSEQALTVYAKSAEQKIHYHTPSNSNILRIELQMGNSKIAQIKEANPSDSIWKILVAFVTLAPDLISNAVEQILPKGDYWTRNIAEDKIFSSGNYRNRVKEDMWCLANRYSDAKTPAEQRAVTRNYVGAKSQKKHRKRICALNDLNVAPVYLEQEEEFAFFPSLYHLASKVKVI